MIVKQILPKSTSENVYTTVWRISILMIECKYNPLITAKLWLTFIADTAVTNNLNGHTTSQTLPPWFQGIINS